MFVPFLSWPNLSYLADNLRIVGYLSTSGPIHVRDS